MLGPATSLQKAIDLSMTDRLARRDRAVIPWRAVVVAALLSLLLGVALALDLAGGHSSAVIAGRSGEVARSLASSRVGSLDSASMARLERQAHVRAAVRRRWLGSSAARAQRVVSRMAFHGLAAGASKQLLTRDYGSVVAGVSASPSVSVARAGRLVRYEGDYRAVVRSAHGLRVVSSTTPLLVGGAGGKRPVDLGLRAGGGGFGPVAPMTGVSIARDSASGVAVGSSGLRMTLEGGDVAGRLVGGQSVFFPAVGNDVDASVAPTISGAEFFAVLRSRLSPGVLRYRLSLPVGAALEANTEGAVVSREGRVLAHILPPSARDAQGSVIPVSMRAVGDELLLSVPHRRLDVAYPVLVDPRVETVVTKSAEGWVFSGTPGDKEIESQSTPPPSMSVAVHEPRFEGEGLYGEWHLPVPPNWKPNTVEFLSMSGEVHGKNWEWRLEACGHQAKSSAGEIERGELPTKITLKWLPPVEEPCRFVRKAISVAAQVNAPSKGSSIKLNVGSIVVVYEPSSLEEEEIDFNRWGAEHEGAPKDKQCFAGGPVNCATGNQVETQSDLSVGGRGPGLNVTRTYNSQRAAIRGRMGTPGPFGYGWTGPASAHLTFPEACWRSKEGFCEKRGVDVYEENGGGVYFDGPSGGPYTAPPLVEATLVREEGKYVYTLPSQTKLTFNESGQLLSRTDRNSNAITYAYNSEGNVESISDAAGRKLTFKYNTEKEVESITDPMGHVVKYGYENGNLTSATEPGEASPRWQFKYNSEHELTEMTDGRKNTVTTTYEAGRAVSQKDALGRERKWKYSGTETEPETTITEPNSSTTVEKFNTLGLPTSVTRASGTSIAATTTYEYNSSDELIVVTDPNKHKTEYGYDSAGNKTSEKDANGNETKWTYNSTHDVETMTLPKGEKTTIKRDTHGNPEVIERPAPGSKTQKTMYKYNTNGDLTEETNPLENKTKYEYDTYGDRESESDPASDKRTWKYNEDSQEIEETSPRKFTTKTERDEQGRPLKVTDPLGHTTKYTYDGNGNLETLTDGNSHKTTYTYDADNEQTKIEKPNGQIIETGYDSAGQVTSQTDGNKHTIKYERNLLEEVTEEIDPLSRKTTKEYDLAGNLKKLTDHEKRSTTYTYDPANRLKEVVYSSGKPATVKYEYDKDGDRTKMTDGTGINKYTFDQLDRLTETENGHKEKVKYEYDLANEQTKITYPNTKAVTRAFDKAGRLEKVTDWSSHATKFSYDADSDLTATTFPNETKNEDKYTYNEADQMSEVKMTKEAETLASLLYERDGDGQVKAITSKGLPGEEKPGYEYDSNNRLTKGGTIGYEYDPADNPTKLGTGAYAYDKANELETGPSLTYTYNEMGQRIKTKPASGPATTYGYDQAGNLTSVERPKEGETTEIKDSYAYDGDGLRASQTISGTTTYLAWNVSETPPLLLADGTNSYIYGPGGLPVEQINTSTGTVTYLHHDQAGSTRMLTSSTGAKEAGFTYDSYGNTTGTTGTAKTPLGYGAQYTSSDTGLIYLRARTYDPATAQFLSVDPAVPITRAPYTYANDNPLNLSDPSGLSVLGTLESAGETLLHAGLDVAAVPPYAVYYGSYELARGINSLGKEFGLPGEVISHLESLPLAQLQALGLAGDVIIDALKNFILGHESICDEGKVGFINPLHGYLPGPLKGPATYLPGVHENGEINFEW
jgi:RHS repeat-associated protein